MCVLCLISVSVFCQLDKATLEKSIVFYGFSIYAYLCKFTWSSVLKDTFKMHPHKLFKQTQKHICTQTRLLYQQGAVGFHHPSLFLVILKIQKRKFSFKFFCHI